MIFSFIAVAVAALGPPPGTIDDFVDRQLAARGIEPANVSSDEQFLRRITLDLAGRIPTLSERDQFLRNPDRSAKIRQLLESPEYPRFLSEIWASSLVGYLNVFGTDREALRLWLEEQFRKDTPYHEIASSLITAQGVSSLDGPVNFLVRNRDDPVVKVGRMFLGVRLDCAQCHDHPFDRWTQDDYQNMRRFFGQLRNVQQNGSYYVRDEIRRTQPDQRPTFLTGARPQTDHWRADLALFVTNSKPFARTFGNRVWYHLMGRGVVHPIDDFNAENPEAVPGLVEYLADQARQSNFSLRRMMELICNSAAYQRESQRNEDQLDAPHVFAYRILKPLTPGQYFDSVATALDLQVTAAERQRFVGSMVGDALQEDLNTTWEYRETVQKALTRLAMPIGNENLTVSQAYRRILTRDPTARELSICREKPVSDIIFALIHSNEFFFNH